jgi:hypothetical protein
MSATSLQSAGPLLTRVLEAQEAEAAAVGYPQLEMLGRAVARRAQQLGDCLVWPAGAAAERIGAAVTLATKGEVEVGSWNSGVDGRRVLLLVVAGVTAMSLESTAVRLRRSGAVEVHGCGVRVAGAEEVSVLDSYTSLAGESHPSLTLVGDAA